MKSPPEVLYGTAWKEADTTRLTRMAILCGFHGIDTANQRKHYFEAAVGDALLSLWDEGIRTREELFLQSKFTYQRGQDHRLPYDPGADLTTQVHQSVQCSLEHLHTNYLDSLVLHSPEKRSGITRGDLEVWRAMETLHDSGQVRALGISNLQRSQLRSLIEGVRIQPSFVQNRCYASTMWDIHVRQLCQNYHIHYQGFSLLTANRDALARPAIRDIAARHRVTIPQAVFAFAMQVGMIPLTGTSDETHMREDLAARDIQLTPDEIATIERAGLDM